MKVVFLIAFLCTISTILRCEKFPIDALYGSNLVNVVAKVVEKVSLKAGTLSIITPDGSNRYAVTDFKDGLLKERFKTIGNLFRQESTKNVKQITRRRHFAMFVVEDYDQFAEIHLKISRRIFQLNGWFIIVLLNEAATKLHEMFNLLWSSQVYNVLAVHSDNNDSVYLKTFIPFKAGSCDDTTPVIIDELKNGSFLRGLESIFPRKMKKLHNCPVRVSLTNDSLPFVFAKVMPNGSYHLSGQVISLLNTLSSSINFKINFTFIGSQGFILENGTAEGPLKALLDEDADIAVGNWWLKIHRLKFFDSAVSHMSENLIFVTPPGRDFTVLEKLVLPFSPFLWLSILLFYLVGFLIIFLVNRLSQSIRNLVFGENVRHPFMNMYIGIVGGTQNQLPRRNFARFLLMMFLLFSLVMRTVYQGSYYKLLRSNMRMPEVQSIEEMINKDFKFYVFKGDTDVFTGTEVIKKRVEEMLPKDIEIVLKKVQRNSSFKGAVGRSKTRMNYFNQIIPQHLRHNTSYIICKDIVVTVPAVLYTKKDFYLLDEFNEKITNFKAAGLIKFWETHKHSWNDQKETLETSSLKLLDLMGCFQILIYGLLLSACVFIVEWLIA